ncbi:MAG: Gldg family protein [Planctomycetaceae bacterium]
MKWHVLDAVFKRNFVAYFSNPTGYVFICVFVLLGSLAAFWPPEFFNSNLANLDQLNRYLPAILLVFIPAITMSVWAEERRQGTDELLLTIPASDQEVVFGKYLACVGIYTVALMFSMVCNLIILQLWGTPDRGLFFANYLGYWFVGLAMLSVGMVASFLTSNLTVGFILGLLYKAPLALADLAGLVMGPKEAGLVRNFGVAEHFSDFGRGVVSLSSVAFFLGVIAVSLYVAMVLIGRRHWIGRRDEPFMGLHYVGRTVGLAAAVIGLVSVARAFDVPIDLTEERISSLAPDTRKLLRELDSKRPVEITAYISPAEDVPEDYAQTRLNLVNMLRQVERLGGGKVQVEVVSTEPNSEAAALASQLYGIEPVTVLSRERGTFREKQLFLGLAVTSGLEKVVVPFFDRGTPVEYELIRSVCTAAQSQRKRLGVLTTDADLFGGFDMMTGQQRPRQAIVDELERQYDVVQVDPTSPITERYDVLLAVQPSSLGPEQMVHLVEAVRAGQPVAIFEDPLPVLMAGIPGTGQPRRGGGGPMAMFQPQGQPKGDFDSVLRTLGVKMLVREGRPAFGGTGLDPLVVWQDYNPHPKLQLPNEFVFIDGALSGEDRIGAFNGNEPVTAGLQEVLFAFPGGLAKDETADVQWTPLVQTGTRSGTIEVEQVMSNRGDARQLRAFEKPGSTEMTLAALVERQSPDPVTAEEGAQGSSAVERKPIRAAIVADIDLMDGRIFGLRDRPDEVFALDFDNVAFVLNVLDQLAGDDRFLEIRKRKPRHRTLERIEETVSEAREMADDQRRKFTSEFEQAEQKANADMQGEIGEFQKKMKELESREDADPQEAMQALQQLASRQRLAQRRLDTKIERLRRTRDADVATVERQLASRIRREQDWQKWLAVLLPPIPPLIVAFFVYFSRRAAERVGVAKSRLR